MARSEQLYKTTGANFRGKSEYWDDFIRPDDAERAYRGRIHEFVMLVNRNSSLGLSQYGCANPAGHSNGYMDGARLYSSETDLKISNKDTITQSDFDLAAQYHPSLPFSKSQAFGARTLRALEDAHDVCF